MKTKWWPLNALGLAALLLLGLLWLMGRNAAVASGTGNAPALSQIEGQVQSASGPLAGAEVRLRATSLFTFTDDDGWFTLTGLTTGVTLPITAWFDGYYISETLVVAPAAGMSLTLSPYPRGDDPDYAWIYPHRADSPPSVDYGCDTCHADVIVAQWEPNAHARAATDPPFLSLYNGTDLTGTRTVPPGFALDFPDIAGNCATCHAPGAGADAPFTTDLNALTPPESNGVFCDFCHKIGGVYLNPASGLPYPNMPGVLSIDLRRPPDGQQMFFGPYTDVPYPDTFLPLIKESQYCAPCHAFSFWGTPIYESFPEWLGSPYASQGITCQDCHMPPDPEVDHFVDPANGGFIRDPMTIPSHKQPGAFDSDLLQEAVTMTVASQQVGLQLRVTVTVTNTGAGHHIPTDFPGRHMILTLSATDGQGNTLSQLSGPVVPAWGGAQAGEPGKAFARVLQDAASGEWPVVSYWKQALILDDNRIPAMGADVSQYAFALPMGGGPVTVVTDLRFRRAFQAVMDAKGWDTPDILMAQAQVSLAVEPPKALYLPLVVNW